MNIEKHIAATIPIAAVSYGITKSLGFAAGVVVGGILIDVDHLVEYWLDCGFSLNVRKFFKYGNSGTNSHHILLFHSVELVLIFMFIADATPYPDIFKGMVWGLILHMVLDYINILTRFHYKWHSFVLFFISFRTFFLFKRSRIDNLLRH